MPIITLICFLIFGFLISGGSWMFCAGILIAAIVTVVVLMLGEEPENVELWFCKIFRPKKYRKRVAEIRRELRKRIDLHYDRPINEAVANGLQIDPRCWDYKLPHKWQYPSYSVDLIEELKMKLNIIRRYGINA